MSDKIQSAFMVSPQSPRKAFYNLIVTGNKVLKVSGVTFPQKKILDKRVIPFENNTVALKFFQKKIKEKGRAGRKRVYRLVNEAG